MKKYLYILLGAFLAIGATVYAVNVTIPQSTAKGSVPIGNANGTYNSGSLVAGSNVTLDTSVTGQITISATGGGGVAGAISTSTPLVNTNVVFSTGVASIGNDSTFTFTPATKNLTVPYASTTAITNSGTAYLGTIASGLWNGTTIGTAFGGTGLTTIPTSQLMYGNGTGVVGTTATTTLTATGALSLSQPISVIGGCASVLSCAVASGSVVGCLATADWTTFNNKQATISVTSPITLTGASVGIVNQGTTAQVLHGNASGNASFGQIVNADITNSTIDLTAKVTGALPVANGGTGRATLTTSQVLFGNGTGVIGSVATTSETCTSPLSCGAFDVLTGGGAITLNTVTVAKGGTNATSFSPNSIITSDSAGTTLIATGTQLTVGNLVATTTTPSTFINASTTKLSINTVAQYAFKTPGFSLATTTAWTATSTAFQLPSPFTAQTINSVQCYTDAGTLNVDIYHTSTHLTLINASTTQNINAFTTNNTMTAGEKWYFTAGTPASSPTNLACTFNLTPTGI